MKKTTPKTPADDSSRHEPLLESLRLAGVFLAALSLAILAGVMCGCRGHKTASAATYGTATATAALHRTDTARTTGNAGVSALTATAATERRRKRIDIERDSDGRPTSILIDETAATQASSATAATVATAKEETARTDATAETKEETESVTAARIEKMNPEGLKDVSALAGIMAVAVCIVMIAALIWLVPKSTK